jgi:hypothetical protein
MGGTQCHLCDISEKDVYLEYNHKETSDKSKLIGLLQNNWPAIFKSAKKMKVKERLRIFS